MEGRWEVSGRLVWEAVEGSNAFERATVLSTTDLPPPLGPVSKSACGRAVVAASSAAALALAPRDNELPIAPVAGGSSSAGASPSPEALRGSPLSTSKGWRASGRSMTPSSPTLGTTPSHRRPSVARATMPSSVAAASTAASRSTSSRRSSRLMPSSSLASVAAREASAARKVADGPVSECGST